MHRNLLLTKSSLFHSLAQRQSFPKFGHNVVRLSAPPIQFWSLRKLTAAVLLWFYKIKETPVWGVFFVPRLDLPLARHGWDYWCSAWTSVHVQWERAEDRYLALSAIAWNREHWLCSLSLVVTQQDIKHINKFKKMPNETSNNNYTNK